MKLTTTLPVPFELPDSLALRKAARDLIDASVSKNTLDAYTRALKQLEQWLDGKPVTDSAIAVYLVHLHEAGKAPATCGQVVAALRFYYKLQGLDSPVGPETDHVLARNPPRGPHSRTRPGGRRRLRPSRTRLQNRREGRIAQRPARCGRAGRHVRRPAEDLRSPGADRSTTSPAKRTEPDAS